MKEPKLTASLTERSGQPVLLISRNDNNLFNRVDWPLSVLAQMGYLGACAHVGKVMLKMLHMAHSEVFEPYPDLQPEDSLANPDEAVQYLLHMSISDRTRGYVPAIDALFRRHADVLSQPVREEWPEMRARILRDYPD